MNQNKKPQNRGGGWRRLLMGILLLVLAVSGVGLWKEKEAARRQRLCQEQLASLASGAETETSTEVQKEETEPSYHSPIDFETLKKENPDTVGWIRIPGTNIDYPIVWDQESNDTYLTRDFYGKESVYGAIFLDADSEPDFSGRNHPIYGHHMKDGSMFKDVVKFKDPEYFKEHQFFELYTPERTIHLKAVSCYYTDADGIVRKTQFCSQKEFDQWAEERLEPCAFAEIPKAPLPAIYSLVTCSYEFDDARTVLFAAEVDETGSLITAQEGEK